MHFLEGIFNFLLGKIDRTNPTLFRTLYIQIQVLDKSISQFLHINHGMALKKHTILSL